MLSDLLSQLNQLCDQGLVIRKTFGDFTLYKYHNKVHYNNLWNTNDALLEARGIVFDSDGEIVQRPFHKIFNVGENGTFYPAKFDVTRKVNGFMGAISFSRKHNKFIYSTTGSLDSDFTKLLEKHAECLDKTFIRTFAGVTFLFEVCDKSDPHIISEHEGIYLIGARMKETGAYFSEDELVELAKVMNALRPKTKYNVDYTWIENEIRKREEVEGFVLYNCGTGVPVAKVKTPRYLTKKALMRIGKNQIDIMFDNPQEFRKRLIDEELYGCHDFIINNLTKQEWSEYDEQERREIIEEWYYG